MSNKQKFASSLYLLIFLAVATFIIKAVFNWEVTANTLSKYLRSLSPFIIGFFIAYLLNPMVRFFNEKLYLNLLHISSKKIRGGLAILTSYVITIGAIVQIFTFIVPQTIDSLMDLVTQIQGWSRDLYLYIYNLDANNPELDLSFLQTIISDYLPKIDFASLTSQLTTMISNFIPTLFSTSMSVINALLDIIIAIMVSAYMLIDKKTLGSAVKKTLYAIMNEKTADSFIDTANHCNYIFSQFIIGKSIDSLIIGILCFIIMSIAKMPYTLLISCIVGVTNLIPYFGPFIGAVPGAIIILLISPMKCLLYLLLILALQQFDGLILGPKILGDSTGLRPIWIIFAITFGGAIAGVVGMFLGVPTVAVIGYLIDRWMTARLDAKGIPEEKRVLREDDSDCPKRKTFSFKLKMNKKKDNNE